MQSLESRRLLTTYDVGPGLPYATVGSVPFDALNPGDVVQIHGRAAPYYEKVAITRSGTADRPIRIVGVPGPNGEAPVLDSQVLPPPAATCSPPTPAPRTAAS